MPEIVVGASPRNSSTDDSGLRWYVWQGQRLVSVTTVRRMAGIPFGLHNWAIGQVIDAAIDRDMGHRITDYFERPVEDDAAELAAIRKELRRAATAERDRAAALGTAVHDAAATGQRLDLVAPELRPRLAQFYNFLEVSGIEVVATEFQVWNPTVGYGGTVDLLGRHRNGTLRVIDLKTGKGIYNDHALQVTAYARAEFAGNDDTINEPLTALLHEAGAPAILHLADDGWEFIVLKPDEELGAWRAFRGLMAFSMWSYGHSDPDSFTAAKRDGKAAILPVVAEITEAAPIAAVTGSAAPGPSVTAVGYVQPGEPLPEGAGDTVVGPRPIQTADVVAEAVAIFAEEIVAIGAPEPVAEGVDRLSRDEFKAMARAAGIKPPFLVAVARELFPAVSDMRLLDDQQRWQVYEAAAYRQAGAPA